MSPKKKKSDGETPQLSLFEGPQNDASVQKVRELEQKITRSMNLKDLSRAKEAAREQEKILQDFIDKKKKSKP